MLKSIFFVACLFPAMLVAQSLRLDSTFGHNGYTIIPVGPSNIASAQDISKQIAEQSSGKIILAGYSHDIGGTEDWIITVVRLTANGTLDHSFGTNGIAKVDFGPAADEGWAVAVQPDDKIVVTGRIWYGSTTKMGIVRLTQDGQLDTTFDSDGKVFYTIGAVSDEGFNLAIQPDGKIIAACRAWQPNSVTGWGVLRLLPNGQLDSTFNGTGIFYYNSGHWDEIASTVVLQTDGKIILGGSISSDPALIRLMPDGTFDTTFNSNGIRTIPIQGTVTSISLDPLDRIVYSAYRSDGICKVGRLLSDGSNDPAFNNGSPTLFNTNQSSFYRSFDKVMFLPDGNFLGIGTFEDANTDRAFSFFILNKNGLLIKSFLTDPGLQYPLCSNGILGTHARFLQDGSIGITSPSCAPGINIDMIAAKFVYNPISVSNSNLILQKPVDVHPNPSSGRITIDNLGRYKTDFITVYNSLGQVCLKKQITQSSMTFDLPENDGVYLINVADQTRKVVKGMDW